MSRAAILIPLIVVMLASSLGYVVEALSPYRYDEMNLPNRLAPPSASHPLGTDSLGRDVLVRLARGLRNSIVISSASTAVALVAALVMSVFAVIKGGGEIFVDSVNELTYAFPVSVAAMVLAFTYGPGIHVIAVSQILSLTPWFYRTLKTIARTVVSQPYFESARAVGVGVMRAAFKYVAAAAAEEIATLFAYGVADAVMLEASISFLGLGFTPPESSLGVAIYEGVRYVLQAPHLLAAPASVMVVLVLSLNIVGDAVRRSYGEA